MDNSVKELRVEIDKCIQIANEFRNSEMSAKAGRELSLVITKLQEAKMWGGKVLEALGSRLPVEYRDEFKGGDIQMDNRDQGQADPQAPATAGADGTPATPDQKVNVSDLGKGQESTGGEQPAGEPA